MSNKKTNSYSILCHWGSWSCLSQIRIEIAHTANDTAITSAMWNIAHASTKQNYIVYIRINSPILCHQNYCCKTTEHIENNQNIIYIYQQSTQETRWLIRYMKISFILWLMHNYLTTQNRPKYRQCQPWLSTSLRLFTFSSISSDTQLNNCNSCSWSSLTRIVKHLRSTADLNLRESIVFPDRYM